MPCHARSEKYPVCWDPIPDQQELSVMQPIYFDLFYFLDGHLDYRFLGCGRGINAAYETGECKKLFHWSGFEPASLGSQRTNLTARLSRLTKR